MHIAIYKNYITHFNLNTALIYHSTENAISVVILLYTCFY